MPIKDFMYEHYQFPFLTKNFVLKLELIFNIEIVDALDFDATNVKIDLYMFVEHLLNVTYDE